MVRVIPIVRSRSGCFTCRRRKKKCDEAKPLCSGCRRNRLDCRWPVQSGSSSPSSAQDSPPRPAAPWPDGDDGRGSPADAPHRDHHRRLHHHHHDGLRRHHPLLLSLPTRPRPGPDDDHPGPAATAAAADEPESQDRLSPDQVRALCRHVDRVAGSMTLLPSHGHGSYELLSHYLSRTANSMGNGSTVVNPFVAKLMPLALSTPLVLQLLLAQSAAHRRAAGGQVSGEFASQCYTQSIAIFRSVVGDYVAGRDDDALMPTVGSLVLCLTEIARGDILGAIFEHLKASRSLLTALLERPGSQAVYGDMADFLVEYYVHTAVSSTLSSDPHADSQPLLSPSIERAARALVARRYTGQLSGCWLELHLLIPQVQQLGRAMLDPVDAKLRQPSADDIVTFSLLQSQILAFVPPPLASRYSQLGGLVYKQATLLYLWSILRPRRRSPPAGGASGGGGPHDDLVRGAVAEAVALLDQFPASARVNTSLCWALAVIGCSTADRDVQHVLRLRLRAMIDSLGLGNIRRILALLERIWSEPATGDMGPWQLHRAMQKYRLWISFA